MNTFELGINYRVAGDYIDESLKAETAAVSEPKLEPFAKGVKIDPFVQTKESKRESTSSAVNETCSSIFSNNLFGFPKSNEPSPENKMQSPEIVDDPRALAMISEVIGSDLKDSPEYKAQSFKPISDVNIGPVAIPCLPNVTSKLDSLSILAF